MNTCKLVVDHRETHVTRHQKELEGVRMEIKQITVGDYAVVSPTNHVIATIERKSLDDFGASLKDGRHLNKGKLVQLREQTGCRILYIIEGPEFPAQDSTWSGIPYKHIESSIFHLMMREGVSVLRARNSLETAKLLVRFITSMNNLIADDPSIGTNGRPAGEMIVGGDDTPAHEQLLCAKHVKSDHEVVVEMWSCFPGIAVETASEFIKRWTLKDIVQKKISAANLANAKMTNGRKISKKVSTSLSQPEAISAKLLEAVPRISRAIANKLLETNTLAELLDNPDLADMMASPGRKLGPTAAANIVKYFGYLYVKPDAEPKIEIEEVKKEVATFLDNLPEDIKLYATAANMKYDEPAVLKKPPLGDFFTGINFGRLSSEPLNPAISSDPAPDSGLARLLASLSL